MHRKILYFLTFTTIFSYSYAQAWSLAEVSHSIKMGLAYLFNKKNSKTIATFRSSVLTISLHKGALTDVHDVDAIVNAANTQLMPGGGLCGALYQAAGPGLKQEIAKRQKERDLPFQVEPGYAVRTFAHDLTKTNGIKYLIHAVGPDFGRNPMAPLRLVGDAYIRSLACAQEVSCNSIAFPPISAGIYRGERLLEELALETFERLKAYSVEASQAPNFKPMHIMIMVYSFAELVAYKKAFEEVFKVKSS